MMMITNELARRNNNKKQFERFPKVLFVDLKFLNFFSFWKKKEIPKFLVLPRYKKENVTKKIFCWFLSLLKSLLGGHLVQIGKGYKVPVCVCL
jgi:hypothetical protein